MTTKGSAQILKIVRLGLGEPPAGSIYNGLVHRPVARQAHRLNDTR